MEYREVSDGLTERLASALINWCKSVTGEQ